MAYRRMVVAACMLAVSYKYAFTCAHAQQVGPTAPHIILEGLPYEAEATSRARDEQLAALGSKVFGPPSFVIVPRTNRWTPGQTLRVAFNGGSDPIYAQIEKAVSVWVAPNAANLKFSFKDNHGTYRHWKTSDKAYAAEIRIAFMSDKVNGGYWSHVGKDSIDPTIDGGSPNQPSMNLEGFDKKLPDDWAGIARHEFGHALGFQHEHQSPVNECDFRFADDPGYELTKDADGWFTSDKKQRRPGLYTYMGGKANYWPKPKVDNNLRQIPTTSAFSIGPFDKTSIMKYYYLPFMFVSGDRSPCYTDTENQTLSTQDMIGVRQAYSPDAATAKFVAQGNKDIINRLLAFPEIPALLKQSLAYHAAVLSQ